MIEDLRITILVDNTVRRRGLLAEHGLAFWIEADGRHLLFDTGQGEALSRNAARLGIPLRTTEKVILSHGHGGHTGGLMQLLQLGAYRAEYYVHPAALHPKFGPSTSPPHPEIGISEGSRTVLRLPWCRRTWTKGPTEVITGIHVTGEIPRRNPFEDTGGTYYLDEAGIEEDRFPDDQAAFIETPAGLVVFLGGAHAGVVNTLEYVAELAGSNRICAVLGGMHLTRVDKQRLDATVESLERYDVQQIVPVHCTDMPAIAHVWSRLPGRCLDCSVGTRLTFSERKLQEQTVVQQSPTGVTGMRAENHRQRIGNGTESPSRSSKTNRKGHTFSPVGLR